MKALFCLAIVVLGVAQVLCDVESPSDIVKAYDECKKETGLPDEVLMFNLEDFNIEDQNVKCFFACMMKKLDLMKGGKVDLGHEVDHIMKHFPGANDDTKKKITDCVNKANEQAEECEAASVFAKCNADNIKGHLS